MAKDADDVVSKKRKKTEPETNGKVTEEEGLITEIEVEKKQHTIPIYQRVTSYEENETLTRDPNEDLLIYKEMCTEFSRFINEIAELKSNKPDGWEEQVVEKKIDAALLTITMKKLNRIEKMRNKTSRESVTKVRQQVDILQLQLQNLLCEIQRLKKEVDKCLVFKPKPLGIDLVSVEEFYEKAPESITRPDVTKFDEHQLQLARLEWELKQRKELSILANQLDEKKNVMSKLIQKKLSDLESLSPLIRDVLTVTKPMQEKLGLPSSHAPSLNELAPMLPHSLYFLYIQASAYSDACDKNITVEISGDIEKARVMKIVDLTGSNSSNDDSDHESNDNSKNEMKDGEEKKNIKRNQLLSKHPLVVIVKIVFHDESSLALEFSYLMKLNILTVIPTLLLPTKIKNSSASIKQQTGNKCQVIPYLLKYALHLLGKWDIDERNSLVVQNGNILTNLFPGDNGLESPNLANYYQLKEVGLDSFDHKIVGSPYLWVQRIGGLDFGGLSPPNGEKVVPKQEIAKISIPNIMKEIYRRFKSRQALMKQVMELETGTVIGPQQMISVKLSCLLQSWEIFSWNEYCKHPASIRMKDSEYVSPLDIFFKGTIIRDQAKLTVLVSVNCSYPTPPPVAVLQLELGSNTWIADNNSDIKDIEREVNVYWKEFTTLPNWPHTLLMLQIHRIMVCFDIMLECNNPKQFSTEKKTFFHPFRGRNRTHPYKFVAMGEGVFLQR